MTSSQLCWKGTVFSAAPAHGHVCMWWCAPMRHVVWWVMGECERVLWCGGEWVQGEKGKRQTHSQTKNKKDFCQNHFFPFPFFPPLFLPLFSPCLPLFHNHTLLIHTFTHFHFSHMGAFMVNQKHQWRNIWFFSSSFLFVQTLSFLFFSFCRWFNVDHVTIQCYQRIK